MVGFMVGTGGGVSGPTVVVVDIGRRLFDGCGGLRQGWLAMPTRGSTVGMITLPVSDAVEPNERHTLGFY
jgi:hypothetical protein